MTLGLKNKLWLKHGLDLQKQSSECIDYDYFIPGYKPLVKMYIVFI